MIKLNLFKIPTSLYEFQEEVNYSQYVFQIEYTTSSDILITAQLIGNQVGSESYDWYHKNPYGSRLFFDRVGDSLLCKLRISGKIQIYMLTLSNGNPLQIIGPMIISDYI